MREMEIAVHYYGTPHFVPKTRPDYGVWIRKHYWALWEIPALLLDRVPKQQSGNQGDIETELESEYERIWDLVQESIGNGELVGLTHPRTAILWANYKNLDIPSSLIEVAHSNGFDVPELPDGVFARNEHLYMLKGLEPYLKSKPENEPSRDASPSPRGPSRRSDETNKVRTLRRILLGLAVDKFHYDPSAPRQRAPQAIADCLARHGLHVSPETVRNHLRDEVAENSDNIEVKRRT